MTIETLQVLWIDEDRRERFIIGSLRREPEGFVFTYGDLTGAKRHGFTPLPEFPDSDREYASRELFATFSERLPDPRRPDYARFLSELGLEAPAAAFEILARSGGMLATDRIELAEERSVGDDFTRPLVFQVRGTQHHLKPEDRPLSPGEELRVGREPTNGYDPHACPLLRDDDAKVGFVPKSYSLAVAAAVDRGLSLRVTIRRSVILPRQSDPAGSRPTWIAELFRSA